MENSKIIADLKARSGKSVKFSVIETCAKDFGSQIFEIVFLANIATRIALVMRNTLQDLPK